MPGDTRVFEDDFNPINSKQERGEADADASISLPMNEKENNTRENNVAKIKVVVCQYFVDISNLYIRAYTYALNHVERSDFSYAEVGLPYALKVVVSANWVFDFYSLFL